MDVDLRDLGGGLVAVELSEGNGPFVALDGEDPRAHPQGDLAGVLVVVERVLVGKVLPMPGAPEFDDVVVGHLADGHAVPRGSRFVVMHPEQPERHPSGRLEIRSQRLGRLDPLEVEPPMAKAVEHLVGE